MNARADIDLVLPCYNPPSGWEEQVATHFREVERLFSPVRFHLFIVSDGSRRGYEPETIDRLRQLIPELSHICNTWVLRIKIKDTQGGMKGFSQAGQAIFLTTRINSFLFDTEFIYKASRRKEINLRTINANIKEGLAVSDMGFKVLRREALNFLSILFHRD